MGRMISESGGTLCKKSSAPTIRSDASVRLIVRARPTVHPRQNAYLRVPRRAKAAGRILRLFLAGDVGAGVVADTRRSPAHPAGKPASHPGRPAARAAAPARDRGTHARATWR